jgi:hypothetical protein
MSTTDQDPGSSLGDKGVCNFMWGPGCTTNTPSLNGNHLCQLPKGHTGDCHCFTDDTYTKLGSLNRARV